MKITVFNRQELYMGFSVAEYERIKTVLAEEGIDFRTHITNRASPFIGRVSNSKEPLQNTCIYYVYVHRDDYETAVSQIR